MIGRAVLVTPVAIVATRPGCVNVTAVALARFVPWILAGIVVPWVKAVGLRLVIVAGPTTVNDEGLLARPLVCVTVTVPVVAPAGTTTINVYAVADETVAVTPLNFTTLLEATGSNP